MENQLQVLSRLSLLILLTLFSSCNKDDIQRDSELFIISGDNQHGTKGEYLTESVIIQFSSSLPSDQVTLLGRPLLGTGTLLGPRDLNSGPGSGFMLNENYQAEFYIRIDCELDEQKFEIVAKNNNCSGPDCPTLATVIVTTKGQDPSGPWQNECGLKEFSIVRESDGTIYAWQQAPFLFPVVTERQATLWKSLDFSSWSTVSSVDYQVLDHQFLPDGSMFIKTNYGVKTSVDGLNWTAFDEGLSALTQNSFPTVMLVEDSVQFIGIDQDALYKTTDRGLSWEPIYFSSYYDQLTRLANGDLLLYDGEIRQLMISEDHGSNWTELPASTSLDGDVHKILKDQNGVVWIVTRGSGLILGGESLFKLNTQTGDLQRIAFSSGSPATIADIQVNQGTLHVLSGNDIYINSEGWQIVNGPELTYPEAEGFFFFAAFTDLFVKGPQQFFLYGGESYSNF